MRVVNEWTYIPGAGFIRLHKADVLRRPIEEVRGEKRATVEFGDFVSRKRNLRRFCKRHPREPQRCRQFKTEELGGKAEGIPMTHRSHYREREKPLSPSFKKEREEYLGTSGSFRFLEDLVSLSFLAVFSL